MPKTNSQVIQEALELLDVVQIGEAPAGEDYEATLSHLEDVLSAIDGRHRVGVDIPSDAIPDWAFVPVAKMVAGAVCLKFVLPEYRPLYNEGLRNLRAEAANESRVDGRPVKVDYF